MPDTPAPVLVNTSPLPDQAWALFRQLLVAAGGSLVAKGAISQSTETLIIGIIMTVAPIIVGQLAVRFRGTILANLATNPAVSQVQPK